MRCAPSEACHSLEPACSRQERESQEVMGFRISQSDALGKARNDRLLMAADFICKDISYCFEKVFYISLERIFISVI